MESQLQIINKVFNGIDVRVVIKDGNPWFVVKDICKILDISSTSTVLSRLEEDEIIFQSGLDSIEPHQQLSMTPESGLYSIILSSRKQEAIPFKKWITRDVIPSIRKTGMYMTENTIENIVANPDLFIELLQKYKIAKAEKIEADKQLQIKTEQVKYAEMTKAYINDKKAATAMNTASQLSKKLNKHVEYATVSMVISTMRLKHIEHPILKIHPNTIGRKLSDYARCNNLFDKTEQSVVESTKYEPRTYHKDIWIGCYNINIKQLLV